MRIANASVALGVLVAFAAGIVTLVRIPGSWKYNSGATPPAATPPALRLTIPEPSPHAPDTGQVAFVGPRENIPNDAPKAYGFWSFAVPVADVLSRSGQPLASEFVWLRERGWKSVVNLRTDGERGEIGDDAKLPGFTNLGFTYLQLPLTDGHPPTDEQAERFLRFVTNPENQPAHVHCRGGIGRAGTMVALYRYAVQGWPMELAINESRAFQGGVSMAQAAWLKQWAQRRPPGSHAAARPAP